MKMTVLFGNFKVIYWDPLQLKYLMHFCSATPMMNLPELYCLVLA